MSYVTLEMVPVGTTITVGAWGSTETGPVDYVDSDIKNGRPGVGYTDANGMSRWCYLEQITCISRKV